MRPSAKYLQQHKFVVAPRPSLAAAALLPLIARSRDALQAMAAASDPPVAPPTSRSLPLPPLHPHEVVLYSIHCTAVRRIAVRRIALHCIVLHCIAMAHLALCCAHL